MQRTPKVASDINQQSFSPREYLKARRPEQFSDTIVDEISILDRSLLEYHLETLTSRGQDKEFEQFARRVAERAICPNLLPQTGPTGGGDSKVDSETYPVADSLSLGWYEGIGREAASERWAFAFSAKKDWRPKLRSDIAKIVETGRGYTKAFFVTNQFVPDRVRAQVEDELRKKHQLDVRVLDRTWILDRVFGDKLEDLAIQTLGISVSTKPEARKGPQDHVRELELEEVQARIDAALQDSRFGPRLVEDCLDAVTLSRGLERPRTEVEGLLARADRIAERAGTEYQRLRSAYLWAWTAYFWYEDYQLFLKWFKTAVERGRNSRNSHDLEQLVTLWSVLYTAAHAGHVPPAEAAVQQHAEVLTAALTRLSKEEGRLSTTLHARTLLLQMRLITSVRGDVEPVLREMGKVVRQAEGLVGYPFEPLVEVLTQLGEFLDGKPAYEELFELIVEVTSKREGELKGARILLKRGVQQLDADRPYEAIRTLGRALRRLQKHESRDELVRALYLCGVAYEGAGLLWAARGSILYAASVATNEFWAYSEISPLQAACYRKMKWLELRLGRLPHVLAWHELDRVIRSNIDLEDGVLSEDSELEIRFTLMLGLLILKADVWQLKQMARLPDVLDDNGLHLAAVALLYALGYEDELPDGFVAQVSEGETVRDLFMLWRSQPGAKDVPHSPVLGDGRTVTLSSRVLGCRIQLESQNLPQCVALSESLLAALEGFLSTAIHERVIAREPLLTVHVREAQFAAKPFAFELTDRGGRPHVEIRCSSFSPHQIPLEMQAAIGQTLFDLLVEIFARVFFVDDPDRVLTQLLREENAPERALQFTTSLVTLGNVLGHEPRTSLGAWAAAGDAAREYPLRRTEEWDAQVRNVDPDESRRQIDSEEVNTERNASAWDAERIRHSEIEMVSLIRESLWNKAGWFGAVYITADEPAVPVLGLVFRHSSAPEQIFLQWRKELGEKDSEERLRVSIIRGIDRTYPHAYRIVIGAKPVTTGERPLVVMMARLLRMDAETDANLERFLTAYTGKGEYVLVPALGAGGGTFQSLLPGYVIKRELHVRDAWQIGMNDPDMAGIDPDEEPIIPEGQQDVPVQELIRWLRTQKT
jgi:tetratricopeptide (TPR) repeat protein